MLIPESSKIIFGIFSVFLISYHYYNINIFFIWDFLSIFVSFFPIDFLIMTYNSKKLIDILKESSKIHPLTPDFIGYYLGLLFCTYTIIFLRWILVPYFALDVTYISLVLFPFFSVFSHWYKVVALLWDFFCCYFSLLLLTCTFLACFYIFIIDCIP